MGFLELAYLWALPVITIPVLIHLIFRQTYKKHAWAAMEFLLRAFKKTRRRLVLENLLLLLLRILVVLCFVLAFARPLVATWLPFMKAVARTEGDVIVVVDTSYSMMLQEGSKTTFDRAIDEAKRLVESLDGKGGVSIVTMCDQPEVLMEFSPNHDSVLRTLDNLEATGGATDVAATLERVNELLNDAKYRLHGKRQVYVFSDLMKYGWILKERKVERVEQLFTEMADKLDQFMLVDLGEGSEHFNLAVDRVASTEKIIGKELPAQFVATIKNRGARPVAGLRVNFWMGDVRRDTKTIDRLGPGESTSVLFSEIFSTSGATSVSVTVDGDKYLTIDDHRAHAFDIVDKIRVVLVDGDPQNWSENAETHYLAHALKPESADATPTRASRFLFERRMLNREEFQRETTFGRGDDVVVLANVGYLTEEKEADLEKFVRQGGGLLVFAGDQLQPQVYNERLLKRGLMPVRLADKPVGEVGYDSKTMVRLHPDFEHPMFTFFKDLTQLFGPKAIGRYYPCEPDTDPSVRVVARFGDAAGAPAIVERRLERGRIVFVATTADDGWHMLPMYDVMMLPMIHEMVYHLVSRLEGDRDVLVHAPIEFPMREVASEVRIAVPDAKGVPQASTTKLPTMTDRFSYEKTAQPGVYRIELDRIDSTTGRSRTDKVYYAVGVLPEEGDLEHLGKDGLTKSYEALREKPYAFGKTASTLDPMATPDRHGQIWQLLIVVALLAMLAESLLAQRTSR